MEERNLQAAQVYFAAKHELMLSPAVKDIQEPNAVAEDVTAGVVPGGDRPNVMLALVEELSAETEEWIKGTGVALDAASEAVAGKKQFSFAPSDFVRMWSCELSRVCCCRHGEGWRHGEIGGVDADRVHHGRTFPADCLLDQGPTISSPASDSSGRLASLQMAGNC